MDLKKKGNAKVQHKPEIESEDLKKMYYSAAFDTTTPTGLQNKVWFKIMLYFCRRGRRENPLKLNQAANGRKYVHQVKDELTKNRREEQEAEECGLMLVSCPVK